MAKRTLGLSKKNQLKKQKVNEESGKGGSNLSSESLIKNVDGGNAVNQIQVEVVGDGDLDDDMVQLRSLWKNYLVGNREDELVLNAIVHECDRLLRKSKEADKNEGNVVLDDEFHAIYASALSELAIFKAGEPADDSKERSQRVSEFFEASLERIDLGMSEFPNSDLLSLAKSKIIFQRIPLQYISSLSLLSTRKDLPKGVDLNGQLEDGKKCFRIVEGSELTTMEPLDIFIDLLDIVANFGREEVLDEGMDSDEEDQEDIELSKSHPLYHVRKDLDKHASWLGTQLVAFFETLAEPTEKEIEEGAESVKFYCKIANKLGQFFLDAASEPSILYTTYEYEMEDVSDEDKAKAKEAQKEAISLTTKAAEYFKKAELPDDPQSWIDTAEVLISLGNLKENNSPEQNALYKEAEAKIRKANVAANGKYEHALEVLLHTEDELEEEDDDEQDEE